MSLWIRKKEKDGKISYIALELPIHLILFILVFIVLKIVAPLDIKNVQEVDLWFYLISLFFCSSGFLAILLAKINLFRKGVWQSWGSKLMTNSFSRLYRAGYFSLIFGVIVSLPLWF